ncbi:MAG: hypothetical protein H0W65_08570 [Sphingomonas sp.]|uniref:head-tail connector protein n=1 Tax=Sphingomonas sp. TaxID=28214 RepID=UPI0017B1D378|nr:hypothetical protein [Sphingomonas sp.]MBA3667762.1 hypothetical protein [Sphingomonas sp.]
MLTIDMAEPAVSMAEAQAYARVETGEEEALLAGLVRSASALCEQFTGQVLMLRPFEEVMAASGEWQRLSLTPVRSIDEVAVLAADGTGLVLPIAAYAVDVDANGDGWMRLTTSAAGRVRVSGQAGLSSGTNGVPEPLRQGILRLVAHLFTTRDGSGGEPPAAVTALWRPYCRMRLV